MHRVNEIYPLWDWFTLTFFFVTPFLKHHLLELVYFVPNSFQFSIFLGRKIDICISCVFDVDFGNSAKISDAKA